MDPKQTTRQHETVIEIPAPVEQVWEAIATAAGVQAWCAPEARIDPHVGGEYVVSWGPGMEGVGRIEVFDEPHHLRTVTERASTGSCEEPGATVETVTTQIAVDYYLESKEAGTVLRLVHSGFLTAAAWDREFESTRKGWPIMLRILRYGLTRHPGVAGRQSWFFLMRNASLEDCWKTLDSALQSCKREYSAAPEEICVEWNEMGPGLLYVAMGSFGGPIGVSANVVMYGDAATRLADATAYWQKELDRLLPAASASTGA